MNDDLLARAEDVRRRSIHNPYALIDELAAALRAAEADLAAARTERDEAHERADHYQDRYHKLLNKHRASVASTPTMARCEHGLHYAHHWGDGECVGPVLASTPTTTEEPTG